MTKTTHYLILPNIVIIIEIEEVKAHQVQDFKTLSMKDSLKRNFIHESDYFTVLFVKHIVDNGINKNCT